jgi:hypothetical protein
MSHADQGSEEFINALVQAIEDFRRDTPQADDITILTLRYVGSELTGVHLPRERHPRCSRHAAPEDGKTKHDVNQPGGTHNDRALEERRSW